MTGHFEKVRAGGAGRLIVDEARAMRAQAIVMPLPRARRRDACSARRVETVLAERPCRVDHPGRPGQGPQPERPITAATVAA